MRKALVILAAALATAAFAGENTGKIVDMTYKLPTAGGPVDFTVTDKAGAELATLTCTKVGEDTKEIKVWWLDPEHMPNGDEELAFTWGDKVSTGPVKNHVLGLCQLRNFNPGNNATITLKVVFVGNVANRIKLDTFPVGNIVPVANIPGEWGSVVNPTGLKGEKEAGLPAAAKYLDLSEYGATVSVDKNNYTATIVWKYEYSPNNNFAAIPNGQFEIGLMQFQK